jgi:Ca2+-binding RTX toxin-like protein
LSALSTLSECPPGRTPDSQLPAANAEAINCKSYRAPDEYPCGAERMSADDEETKRRDQLEAATGAVIETLEHRRLLSVTLGHGILTVRGTADNDVLTIISEWWGAAEFSVADNGDLHTFRRADVTGIVILGGDGHDELGATAFASATDIRMTIRGGAGDDTLVGSAGPDLLNGGSGDDVIRGNGGDQINPESADDDYFHGTAADLPSMRVHNGVLYLTGTTGDDVIDVTTWEPGLTTWLTGRPGGGSTRAEVSTTTTMPWKYGWFAQQNEWEPVSRVVIDGRGGNDLVRVSRSALVLPKFGLTVGGVTRDIAVTAGVFRIGADGSFGEVPDSGGASLVDGVLTVRGTSAADVILLGSWWDDDLLNVQLNRVSQTFERSEVREIRINCGDGNDIFWFWNLSAGVFIPVIANGDGGDDWLHGQEDGRWTGCLILGPFDEMHATLLGGDGDDVIVRGLSNDYADGGAGNNELVGFPPPPEPPAPVEQEPTARPTPPAEEVGAPTAPVATPSTVQLPFSTALVIGTSASVFGDHADDVWDPVR